MGVITIYQDYFTLAQAAYRTGLSKDTLHRWVKTGILPATKVRRQFLVYRGDLDALLTKSKYEA